MNAQCVFLVVLAVSASYWTAVSGQCASYTGTTTTFIVNSTSNCQSWIACKSGEEVNSGSCATGYLFNTASSSCEIAADVTCAPPATGTDISTVCQGQPNGAYVANPDNCNGYFYCDDNVGDAGLCNSGYIFNATSKLCVYMPNYQCPVTVSNSSDTTTSTLQQINATCAESPTGTFLSNPSSCSAYYVCVNGNAVAGSCNSTIPLYFDVSTASCVYPSQVSCSATGSSGSSAVSVPYNYTEICSTTNTTALFAADPAHCNGYFYCSNEANTTTPSHGYCPEGYYFDASTQLCADPSSVTCELQPCVDQPVGYFASSNSSCASFNYCSANGPVAGNCTTGYYFDVVNQDCNTPAAVNCTLA